jgi:hypothetical protein
LSKELASLPPEAQTVMSRTLAFLSTTRRLDEAAFETRVVVDRGITANILMRWPAVDGRDNDSPSVVAITNALNEAALYLICLQLNFRR